MPTFGVEADEVNEMLCSPFITEMSWRPWVATAQLVVETESPRIEQVPTDVKVTTPPEIEQIEDDSAAIVKVTKPPPVTVAVGL